MTANKPHKGSRKGMMRRNDDFAVASIDGTTEQGVALEASSDVFVDRVPALREGDLGRGVVSGIGWVARASLRGVFINNRRAIFAGDSAITSMGSTVLHGGSERVVSCGKESQRRNTSQTVRILAHLYLNSLPMEDVEVAINNIRKPTDINGTAYFTNIQAGLCQMEIDGRLVWSGQMTGGEYRYIRVMIPFPIFNCGRY